MNHQFPPGSTLSPDISMLQTAVCRLRQASTSSPSDDVEHHLDTSPNNDMLSNDDVHEIRMLPLFSISTAKRRSHLVCGDDATLHLLHMYAVAELAHSVGGGPEQQRHVQLNQRQHDVFVCQLVPQIRLPNNFLSDNVGNGDLPPDPTHDARDEKH